MNGEAPRERSGDPGRWPRYQRPGTDDVERETRDAAGHPLPEAPAPSTSRSGRRDGHGRRGRKRLGSAVVVLAAFGLVRAFSGGEQAPEPLPAEDRYQPIATAESLAALGAALSAQTGGTQVLELRGYGTDEMQVTVPPAQPGDLAEVWRWDGRSLEKWMGEQAGDKLPFALTDVDPDALVAVDRAARGRSDGRISDSRYDVEKPVDVEYDHWIYLHVDEVDHGGVSLWADLAGTIEGDLVHKSWRDD